MTGWKEETILTSRRVKSSLMQRFMRSMRFFSEMLCSTMKKTKHTNDYACRSRPVLASGLVSRRAGEPSWQQGLRKGENPREEC